MNRRTLIASIISSVMQEAELNRAKLVAGGVNYFPTYLQRRSSILQQALDLLAKKDQNENKQSDVAKAT